MSTEEYGVVTDRAKASIINEGGNVREISDETNIVSFPAGIIFCGDEIKLPSGTVLGYDGKIDRVCFEDEASQVSLYLKKKAK
jgi:hypothetical protein